MGEKSEPALSRLRKKTVLDFDEFGDDFYKNLQSFYFTSSRSENIFKIILSKSKNNGKRLRMAKSLEIVFRNG